MNAESLGNFKLLTHEGCFKGPEQTQECAFSQARKILPLEKDVI
jgi:hypothetical protein